MTFDEPVDVTSAESATNYSLDKGVILTNATLLPDGRTVALLPDSNLAANESYTLTVDHVKDRSLAGNEMPAPVTNVFTFVPILLSDDFADDVLEGWTVVDEGFYERPSLWRERSGHLMQVSNIYGPNGNMYDHRKGTYVYWNDPASLGWSNYTLTAFFNSMDDDGVGVLFRYQNPSNYYKLELDSSKRFRKLFKLVNGVETTLATEYNGYGVGSNYVLRLDITNNQFVVLLNGSVLFNRIITDNTLQSGTVGLYSWADAGVFFDDVKVIPLHPWPLATIQSPTNGAVFSQLDLIPVTAEVSAPEGHVKRVDLLWGSALVASLTNAPYSFQWQAPDAANYTFVAEVFDDADQVGISSPVSFVVIRPPQSPTIIAQPGDQSVHLGDDAVFCCRSTGQQPLHYQWLLDGEWIEGATNAFIIVHQAQPGNTGSYSVVVTNEWGIVVSDEASLSLDWSIPPPGNTNDPPSLCFPKVMEMYDPGGLLLSVNVTNINVVNVEWSPDLQLWSLLQTLTNNCALRYFADPDAVNQHLRFYRAVASP